MWCILISGGLQPLLKADVLCRGVWITLNYLNIFLVFRNRSVLCLNAYEYLSD